MSVVRAANCVTKPAIADEPKEQHEINGITVASFFRWKRFTDVLLGSVVAIFALPVIGLLIALVKLTSRGPGIYRQTRVSQDGRPFKMYKIRTMRCDAEATTGPVWTRTNDSRVTRIGGILRRLHLDELPQIINILQGDMSLVGPRPERPEFVFVLEQKIPGYANRHAIKPGVTGLAQINLPPDSDLNSVRRKLVLDVEYAQQATAWMDIRILCCTFVRMLGLPTASTIRILRLERKIAESEADDGSSDAGIVPLRVIPDHASGNA